MPPLDTPARALRRAGWLAGLPALALVWVGTTLAAAPGIAARLLGQGEAVAADTAPEAGEPWLRVEVRGRDLVARGEAPDVAERAVALGRLAALDGPRRIVSEAGIVETASPFLWSATRTGGGVALEGSRPVEVGRRVLEARVAGPLAPGTALDDGARAARGAPPDFPAAAGWLAARLAVLGPGGRAALSDTVLSLAGEARDVPAYDALRAALAEPPAGYSLGRVEVLPPRVADYRIALERVGAGISLEGFAPTEAVREAARAAAARAAEGGPVDDRLHTARGLPAEVDAGALVAFLGRLAGLVQSGRAAYAGGAVSVTGDAIDAQALPEAQALMREARPAGVAAGPVDLAVRPLSPYRVSVRRSPEGVSVGGHLPDAGARERLLAALRPRLFREPVDDRTRLADGAPADLVQALEAAVPILTTLASGEVAVSDRSVRLTGESLYRESAERAPARLAAALPPGWSASAAVQARDPAERREPLACREGFSAATASADLRFPAGSAALAPAFYPTLDALAALARTCPDLRITVSGPADPGKPAPAGSGDGARTEKAEAPKVEAAKAATAEAKAATAEVKPGAAKPRPAARKDAKADREAPRKPEEEAPADLAHQRALALVEYLLQAGARPDQVAPGPDGTPGRAAFALAP